MKAFSSTRSVRESASKGSVQGVASCNSAASLRLVASLPRAKVVVQGSPYSTPLTAQTPPLSYKGRDKEQSSSNGNGNGKHYEAAPAPRNNGVQFAQPQGPLDFAAAEDTFVKLLAAPNLDVRLEPRSSLYDKALAAQAAIVERTTAAAMEVAYGDTAAALGLPLLPGSETCGSGHASGSAVAAAAASVLSHSHEPGVDSASSKQAANVAHEVVGRPQSNGNCHCHDKEQVPQRGVYAGLSLSDAAHLFAQRLLYRINRLCLFWYDALDNYTNERSLWLARLRDGMEAAWTAWEAEQLGHERLQAYRSMSPDEIKDALRQRYDADVDPPLSAVGSYISHDMGVEGYRELLSIASLDGLVEASRQSRVCGGAANEVMCMVFKVLAEEYGNGRMPKKHSTFFASMMRELGLSDEPEAYLDTVPWQVLAGANHNFLLTERRRHYLRYLGGLTFFEIVGPSVYRTYLAAAKRLNLSEDASGYWALHIKEDERHGKWMLDGVAIPLVDMYPDDAYEVLLGYDQERFMAQRAANVVLSQIRGADQDGYKARPAPISHAVYAKAQERAVVNA